MKIFFAARSTMCGRLRLSLRLCAACRRVRMHGAQSTDAAIFKLVTNVVHRFEQSIAGRPYLIEVANVSQDRWRAYIVRIPGVPTALMPFYGQTPDEAADQLSQWLTRANKQTTASI